MKERIKGYFIMTAGVVIISIAVYFLKITNGFTTGGVSGIGTVLGRITPIQPTMWIGIINILLLLIGFIVLGKQTGIKTVYCSVLFSSLMWLFEALIPLNKPLTDQPFLELVIAVFMTSFGAALVFNIDATTGGTDIVAMIIKKYTNLNVGTALLCVDLIVVLSTFFVFGLEIGLFSMLGLFVKAFLVDGIIEAFNIYKYVLIISENTKNIEDFIIKELNRGMTVTEAEGGYTRKSKKIIHTVCKRSQAIRLKNFIKTNEPDAFIVITDSHEIIGRGFRSL